MEIYVRYFVKGREIIKYLEAEELEINLTPIQAGVYNYKNTIIIIQKTGDRQWKRGFCKGAYHVRDPLAYVHEMWSMVTGLAYTKPSTFDWTTNNIQHIQIHKPTTYKLALASINRDSVVARVLDKDWFISLSLTSDGVWLFYRSCKVATIIEDSIHVNCPDFLQEIIDLNTKFKMGEFIHVD